MSLNKQNFIQIAEKTRVFKEEEIKVLEELLDNYQQFPNKDYSLLTEYSGNELAGFIIMGQTPMTESAWDIYWLVVDPQLHGQGIGRKLIQQVEDKFQSLGKKAVLRVETAGKKSYAAARAFYDKMGFTRVGQIKDFYADQDDLIIYSKTIG